MTRRACWCALMVAPLVMLSCSSGSDTSSSVAPTTRASADTVTSVATTSPTAATTSTSTSITTTTPPASTSTSTSTTLAQSLVTETRVIGQSVQGRDITAYRMGVPNGRPWLLIAVIHGNP